MASLGGIATFSFWQAESCSVLLCSSMLDLIFQMWMVISTEVNLLFRKWLPVSVLVVQRQRGLFWGVTVKGLPESFESSILVVCKWWHS